MQYLNAVIDKAAIRCPAQLCNWPPGGALAMKKGEWPPNGRKA